MLGQDDVKEFPKYEKSGKRFFKSAEAINSE